MAERVNAVLDEQQLLEVRETSDAAEARRVAIRFASKDFTDLETANVALVATELATNLIKHAKGGWLIVRGLQQGENIGVELMALDHGPGINDLAGCLRDGYSTAGSSGTGLGAIKRLARQFDIHSIPGKGTVVLARLWAAYPMPRPRAEFELGVIHLPMAGQEVSGDGWGVECLKDKYSCALADGLGHGPDAAIAAQAALSMAREHRDKAPAEIIERAHGALRSTRGAALAVAEIDAARELLRFCGVGNIAAKIVNNLGIRHLISYNGIVGQEVRKIAQMTYPWSSDSLLIMHSDGLSTRWDLASYPALLQRHPALIAAVLYRDFSRGRDDSTVLVSSENVART
jgi:anti-sigma regulatory factor (Ser/Thr protein kinase)